MAQGAVGVGHRVVNECSPQKAELLEPDAQRGRRPNREVIGQFHAKAAREAQYEVFFAVIVEDSAGRPAAVLGPRPAQARKADADRGRLAADIEVLRDADRGATKPGVREVTLKGVPPLIEPSFEIVG